MSDETPAVWTDYLSNDLVVRRYADGDVVVYLTGKRHESALLDDASVGPLIRHLRDDDLTDYREITLTDTDRETELLRYFNDVVLIETNYGTMPLSHSLASELVECLEKNGQYGTGETASQFV